MNCSCGHIFETTPRRLDIGNWCGFCCNPPKKLCEDDNCKSCFEKSFAAHKFAPRWSKKNDLTARQVFRSSMKMVVFDCDLCGHDYTVAPNSVGDLSRCSYCHGMKLCEKEECKYCFERSFASHQFASRWSKKNVLTARQVVKGCNKTFSFDCEICNHTFECMINSFSKSTGCPYCAIPSRKRCVDKNCKSCFERSFASHPRAKFWNGSNDCTPREISKACHRHIIMNCDSCEHTFETTPADVSSGSWCPYCAKPCKRLCDDLKCKTCLEHSFAAHPKSKYLCEGDPRQIFRGSGQIYEFICEIGHKFKSSISHITTNNSWCPSCYLKTQSKVNEFLVFHFGQDEVIPEFSFPSMGRSRFDFALPIFKIIIEIDGEQHFRQVRNWNSPEEALKRDVSKMETALLNGYSIIRIYQPDIASDKLDWKELIVQNVQKYEKPTFLYFSTISNIYDNHKKSM